MDAKDRNYPTSGLFGFCFVFLSFFNRDRLTKNSTENKEKGAEIQAKEREHSGHI